MLTGSSRHNTGFVGDLLEFYKPVYAVCYPSIILLHHMVFPRILQHQTGRQEKTRTPIHHNYECLLEERNCLKTLISMIAVCSAESLSHVCLSVTPWTATYPGPSGMGFFRQQYWIGLPFPFSGNLPDLGIEPMSPALQVASCLLNHQGSPWEAMHGS